MLVKLGVAQSRAGNETHAVESFAQADKLLPATASYNAQPVALQLDYLTLALEKNDEALVQVDRLREIARPDARFRKAPILRLAEPLKVPLK